MHSLMCCNVLLHRMQWQTATINMLLRPFKSSAFFSIEHERTHTHTHMQQTKSEAENKESTDNCIENWFRNVRPSKRQDCTYTNNEPIACTTQTRSDGRGCGWRRHKPQNMNFGTHFCTQNGILKINMVNMGWSMVTAFRRSSAWMHYLVSCATFFQLKFLTSAALYSTEFEVLAKPNDWFPPIKMLFIGHLFCIWFPSCVLRIER